MYKWDASHKSDFRLGLIAELPIFNELVNSIDINSRTSVNYVLNNFTTIVNVADPLFCHRVNSNYSGTSKFTDSELPNDHDWFDAECRQARQVYVNALNVFNSFKTHCNRQNLCRLKNAYKKLCSKKKREFENIQIKKLTDLKKERPKEFWNFFKKKRRKCNSISTEDFFTYFKSLGADIF